MHCQVQVEQSRWSFLFDVDAEQSLRTREQLLKELEDPHTITRALRLMMVAKYFERIGDGATNVCEMIVYLVEGRVIRHGGLHPADGGTE